MPGSVLGLPDSPRRFVATGRRLAGDQVPEQPARPRALVASGELDRHEVGDSAVRERGDLAGDCVLAANDRDVGWTLRALAVEHGPVGRQKAVYLEYLGGPGA